MEYKNGEVFYDDELKSLIECVEDGENDDDCGCCVFSDGGNSCPPRCYNQHPCYCVDRKDGNSVHFVFPSSDTIGRLLSVYNNLCNKHKLLHQ